MRAICTAVICFLFLAGWLPFAYSQSTDRVASAQGEKKIEGQTIVIELPPTGKQVDLTIDSTKHTTLVFDRAVKRVVGNPQGATAKRVKGRTDHVAIWPHSILPDFPKEHVKPLGGNFSVELEDRTLSVGISEMAESGQSTQLANVRTTPGKVELLEQKVKEAQDTAANAKAGEAKAKREASEAKQDAADARARAVRAQTEADKATEAADKARAEAKAAREDARVAREDAEVARAEAEAAKSDAEVAKEGQERAQRTMLTTVAAEIFDEEPVRLSPEASTHKPASGRLSTEFLDGVWKNEYFLLGGILRLTPGRPIEVEAVKVRRNKRELATRVVSPDVTPLPSTAAIGTLVPGKEKRVAFAIDVPPHTDLVGATLELYVKGQSAPLLFEIPRYYQRVSPISEAEFQRMQWAKQVVIGPRVALGGCGLASGVDGDGDLSIARCGAVGLSIAKGYHSYIAAGVETTFGWTGDAEFDREQSSTIRNAKLFRVLGYGDLRFSRGEVVPYLRVGVALQATRYGGTNPETDIFGVFAAGGGVQFRLGENFSITTGGSFSWTGEKVRTIQADVHLGYGWN